MITVHTGAGESRLSTISAHGRALKLRVERFNNGGGNLSTISAHGRALKRVIVLNCIAVTTAFNNFGSR